MVVLDNQLPKAIVIPLDPEELVVFIDTMMLEPVIPQEGLNKQEAFTQP